MVRRKPVPQPLSLQQDQRQHQHQQGAASAATSTNSGSGIGNSSTAPAPAATAAASDSDRNTANTNTSASTGTATAPASTATTALPARANTATGTGTATANNTATSSHSRSATSFGFGETVSSASRTFSPANTNSISKPPGSASAATRTSPFSSRFATNRPQTAKASHSSPPAFSEPFNRRSPSQPHVDYQSPKSTTPYPHIASAYSPSKAQSPPPQSEPKSSKGSFFHFAKPSKSTDQFLHHAHQDSASSRGDNRPTEGDGPSARRQGDSSPAQQPPVSFQKHARLKSSRSQLSLSSSGDRDNSGASTSGRKSKANPFGLLSRSRSFKNKGSNSPSESHDPMPATVTSPTMGRSESPPKGAASATHDRSFREMMDSSVRHRSEDRVPTREGATSRERHREKEQKEQKASLNARENGGSTFFSGLKSSSTKAAGMFGRSLFGKGHRSATTTEKDPALDDEHYELKVINLPLAEQTRKTRISKRLEDSRDKTEFWMPSFPWRAIDYLNYKGCEVEGLYRVPGSGPQVKKWQRKFDEQLDVNLFEADDLYDINIIGSMLKAWLRELPDELFPKAAQERISRECAGSEEVPQMLIDELSNLSPFQYYLLFAITCHLSLLLAHSEKNKMDFRNLCICFQPCMKIDAFCFKFLVCDWRDCWKGCKNENAYIEQEYVLMNQPPPPGIGDSHAAAESEQDPGQNHEQQAAQAPSPSSETSNKHPDRGDLLSREPQQGGNLESSNSKNSVESHNSTLSSDLTINSDREPPKATSELRRLSPIAPLSPMGFN